MIHQDADRKGFKVSTSPMESVFGFQASATHVRTRRSRISPPTETPTHRSVPAPDRGHGTEIEWTNAELHSMRAPSKNCSSGSSWPTSTRSAAKVETTEFEIGRLLSSAAVSEDSLSRLESQIQEILCAAEDKAKQILTEATEEALEIDGSPGSCVRFDENSPRAADGHRRALTTVKHDWFKELRCL